MSTVKVIDADGRALNNCHPARARQLLKEKRARVVTQKPYTIQLLRLSANKTNGQAANQEA
jgi:hypothetical protein